MFALVRKWALILFFLTATGFLLYQGLQFRLTRHLLPKGTEIGGLDVSGLSQEEATNRLTEVYYGPVYLYHRDEHVELNPTDVGFVLDLDQMLAQAEQQVRTSDELVRFAGFLLNRPLEPITVPLMASHDRDALRAMIQTIADFLDRPAQPPRMLGEEEPVRDGEQGFITDVEASLLQAEPALYRIDNRVARLAVVEQDVPELSLELVKETISNRLQTFNGLGSIFVLDLQTGEEIGINSDVAVSGLSILKIAIFVEAFRALDGPPNEYQQQLFTDTATRSSNFGANLLLHIVAGEDNTYRGADILTESMRRLGLINTFMAVPYDATPPDYRQTTYVTPANSRTDVSTLPDATMQSTAEEIGSLLAMIYDCSNGGGTLLAVYPDELTAQECQAIIDLMILNEEGNLIRYGVPDGTPVSHKHGWALGTHADAGIVFSPGGDYVLVEYLNQPGDWLVADESFPILREIARTVYNYFNMDEPYLLNDIDRRPQIDPDNPFSENQELDLTTNESR